MSRWALACPALLCALTCALIGTLGSVASRVYADDVPPQEAPPKQAPAKEAPAKEAPAKDVREKGVSGAALFAAATRWVRGSAAPVEQVQRVFVDLQDVTISGSNSGSHEGNSRIHLDLPQRMRWELRKLKRTPLQSRRVKVLDGNEGWLYVPAQGASARGTWERLHGNQNNPGAIAQLKKDRDLFAALTRYLTLRGLSGPGVTFTNAGLQTFPKRHHLAGRWLKVRRVSADGKRMAFLFAWTADAKGGRSVRQPHAVLVPGDKAEGRATEHILLTKWKSMAGRRVPQQVVRYTEQEPGVFRETLRARVMKLAINPVLAPQLFKPLPPKAP